MIIRKLFLSYSRVDGAIFALRLARDLNKEGFDVWIDQEDITAGRQWDLQIESALEACDCLLYIETAHSVDSPNVLDEVYYALEQKKKVIPLIVVDSKTPFRLQRIQHIDFTQHYQAGLNLLITELKNNNIVESSLQSVSEIPIPKTSSRKRRNFIFLIAALAIVLTAIALTIYNNKAKPDKNFAATSIPADTMADAGTLGDSIVAPILNNPMPAKLNERNSIQQNRTRNVKPIAPIIDDVAKKSIKTAAASLSGDWKLESVNARATSSNGYLKIKTLENDKINIQSYVQFYYPKLNDTLYLSVFNAFTSCAACNTSSPLKLSADDVSLGLQYFQILKQDVPPENRTGDTIKNAGANRSIRAMASLHFSNNNTAQLIIERPDPAQLSYGLEVKPFKYIFKFSKLAY